ncbi:MAG: DUF2141 domain-containing protein [Bacteroidota bacterium]
MIYTLLLALSCFSMNPVEAPESGINLQVSIEDIETIGGSLRVCLIANDPDKFLNDCDWGQVVAVHQSTVTVEFSGLKPGTYCISLFHDEDNNGQLNTEGLFGLPSEPYGFSNNPKTWFGPPSFEDCQFILDQDTQLEIRL